MRCSPPSSSVREIAQARILEWIATSFSRELFWPRDQTQVSCIAGRHFTLWATREDQRKKSHYVMIKEFIHQKNKAFIYIYASNIGAPKYTKVLIAQSCPTLWTSRIVARQALLSMELPRQEYWSGLPLPSPGDLPGPGIESGSPALQANFLPFGPPWGWSKYTKQILTDLKGGTDSDITIVGDVRNSL